MANFRQKYYNILLLRFYDNGSDTQGILYFTDMNGDFRYVFTQEETSGKRLLPGKYELRLIRFGEAYEILCRYRDGYIKKSSYQFGVIALADAETPIFNIEYGKWSKIIILGNKIENNSNWHQGKIDDIPRAYAFATSSIYRAFEESRRIFLNILNTDQEIKNQFSNGNKYGIRGIY